MSTPNTFRTIYFKIGNGNSPETFTHDCIINSERGVQFQSQGQDVYLPDCSSPESPAWREHFKTGLSATVTGSGKADSASLAAMDTWFRGDTAKNAQVWAEAQGNWEGAWKLTQFQITGDPLSGNPVEFSATFESHGTIAAYSGS
jgi:predicted secreted protein